MRHSQKVSNSIHGKVTQGTGVLFAALYPYWYGLCRILRRQKLHDEPASLQKGMCWYLCFSTKDIHLEPTSDLEELSTFLVRIEVCLNSRPLAPMSEDPADLLKLTLGHFLVGGPLLATVEPEIKGDTTSIINHWQHLKALLQQFCLRWKEEYLKECSKGRPSSDGSRRLPEINSSLSTPMFLVTVCFILYQARCLHVSASPPHWKADVLEVPTPTVAKSAVGSTRYGNAADFCA
ncbi:uncharacterized protein LOC120457602 [Drosophila santomea]|uniref:uncharacterized protein LOC120457602 n=1 Tax=Drosophila santomea TaxID=129105 RepID=UPI001954E817|nr:uncharacterized protein LOC120457602 [Drosophila santomea]